MSLKLISKNCRVWCGTDVFMQAVHAFHAADGSAWVKAELGPATRTVGWKYRPETRTRSAGSNRSDDVLQVYILRRVATMAYLELDPPARTCSQCMQLAWRRLGVTCSFGPSSNTSRAVAFCTRCMVRSSIAAGRPMLSCNSQCETWSTRGRAGSYMPTRLRIWRRWIAEWRLPCSHAASWKVHCPDMEAEIAICKRTTHFTR